jgi:hypothetical protein
MEKHKLSAGVLLFPVQFKVFKAVIIKSSIFRNTPITQCILFRVTNVSKENLFSPQERNHRNGDLSRASSSYLIYAGFLLDLFSDHDNRGVMSLRNVG